MPAEIQRRFFDGSEHTLSMVFPGDRAVLSLESTQGLGEKLVLVCCDSTDECTDVFVCDRPEDMTSLGQEYDLDKLSAPENLVAQIYDGHYHAIDMKQLGIGPTPSLLIMSHSIIMSSN
jgi:hypothetical protein